MKKIILFFAAAAMVMTAGAETQKSFTANKLLDNWYVSLNGGVGFPTVGSCVMSNLNPNVGLRLGKMISPYFGLGLEADLYFSNKAKGENISENGTPKFGMYGIYGNLNLMNAIAGYKGVPRPFEVSVLTGLYWGHNYGDLKTAPNSSVGSLDNLLVHKIAVDFAYNFGKSKEWQVYLEPAINYGIAGLQSSSDKNKWMVRYDINRSFVNVNVGVTYKFKTSNGTHNFMLVDPRDPEEIAELNNSINALRESDSLKAIQVTNLKKEVMDLQEALNECNNKPAPKAVEVAPSIPAVFFECDKWAISAGQDQNVKIVAEVMKQHPEYKVTVKGYASPEGPLGRNNMLGEKRAESVKNRLIKYGIAKDRITAEGCGPTDKLFQIVEFNRVSMMSLEK